MRRRGWVAAERKRRRGRSPTKGGGALAREVVVEEGRRNRALPRRSPPREVAERVCRGAIIEKGFAAERVRRGAGSPRSGLLRRVAAERARRGAGSPRREAPHGTMRQGQACDIYRDRSQSMGFRSKYL